MKKIILISMMCLFSLSQPIVAEKLQLATISWPPYIGEQLQGNGFISEIITMACKEGNLPVSFEFVPVKRAIKSTEEGYYAAMFPYTGKGTDSLLLSEPFGGSALVFYKNKSAPAMTFESIEKLKSYKIAVVKGFAYTKEFDEATYLNKYSARKLDSCFKMLALNRVDLVLADKFVATDLFKNELSKIASQIEQIDPPFAVQPFYLAFTKNKSTSDPSMQQFNAGLQKIKSDGTLNEMLVKYGYFTMSSSTLSPKELESFVKSALDYIEKVGMEKAVVEFKKKEGLFSKGELYIFVINMDGLMISHVFPHLVGKNVINMQDKFGFYLIKEFAKVIKEKGSGWVEYWWPNPVTKNVQPKVSYVLKIDRNTYLGAGIYK